MVQGNNELTEIIEGLKGYLSYLKMMGIKEIPVNSEFGIRNSELGCVDAVFR